MSRPLTIKSWYNDERLTVIGATYRENHAPALQLRDEQGHAAATASVNIPEMILPVGHVLIKNWFENEGVLSALVEAGIVIDTGTVVPCGHAQANLCRLKVAVPDDPRELTTDDLLEPYDTDKVIREAVDRARRHF